MKISRKPTPPPRPTAPSRPSRLVTANTALARRLCLEMGLLPITRTPVLTVACAGSVENISVGGGRRTLGDLADRH